MATTTGIASGLLVPGAPPSTSTETATATAPSPAKTMEQLMNEIDETKKLVETAAKNWEKLDLGRKKIEANRAQAIQGRTEIHGLKERVLNLQKQVDAATQAADPTPKTFDKRKKNAQKALSNLSSKLDHAEKHLEKATGSAPVMTVPVAGASSTTTPASGQPAAAPTTTTEAENTKGLRGFIGRLPLTKKKSTSKEALNTTTQPAPATAPLKPVDDAAQKTKKDAVASRDQEEEEEEEEEDEGSDDDDVISDNKKG
jgi:hypothetical protein